MEHVEQCAMGDVQCNMLNGVEQNVESLSVLFNMLKGSCMTTPVVSTVARCKEFNYLRY